MITKCTLLIERFTVNRQLHLHVVKAAMHALWLDSLVTTVNEHGYKRACTFHTMMTHMPEYCCTGLLWTWSQVSSLSV